MRDAVAEEAGRAQPARARRRRAPVPRLDRPAHLSRTSASATCVERYGYLAKQFTVFGQHVHVGCTSGDDAVYLVHMLTRYVPHFIALSAASPYLPGRGHVVPVLAPHRGQRVSARRPHAVRARLGRIPRLLRQDEALRHRRQHEGLLLGHPAQARVRHDRDPRLRHAAHGARARRSSPPTRRRSPHTTSPSGRASRRARPTW